MPDGSHAPLRIGVVGLGSVFGPYSTILRQLAGDGSAYTVALADSDPAARARAAAVFPTASLDANAVDLLRGTDVDAVVILTSMSSHGSLAETALLSGKHVLVEKPLAPTLEEARRLIELSRDRGLSLVCAPHVLMSPTFLEMHAGVRAGVIGEVRLARAMYGWAGPTWGDWFYRTGGGALRDLGVYNITTLCGFLGPVRRVTSLMGIAVPRREVQSGFVAVEVADNAQVLLDFGCSTFASVTTGFTIQRYGHAPGVELYGLAGTMNMLGDDWAPQGFEQWRNDAGCWETFPETAPQWPWVAGVRHFVDLVTSHTTSTVSAERAYHVLEVMVAAERSAALGRAVEVSSHFPDVAAEEFTAARPVHRLDHDHRILG